MSDSKIFAFVRTHRGLGLPMKRYFQVTPSFKELATGRTSKTPRLDDVSSVDGCPLSFVTFNVNSLNARLKAGELTAFSNFIKTHNPDFISLQEVRLPAESKTLRDRISPKFSDTRAIQRFIESNFGDYVAYWSLADKGYAGTLTLIRRTMAPKSIQFNLEQINGDGSGHHPEGRISVCVYDGFTILSTYSPNNGRTEQSLQRRLQWDQAIYDKLTGFRKSGIEFIWLGDLNVAPTRCDMSHPNFYKQRDQPGCTDAEQERHQRLLTDADAVDAYRFLNPAKLPGPGELFDGHTWRGHDSGMYNRKTMRIDHFVVSKSLASRIKICITHGPHEWTSFFGSDHCPVRLVLNPNPSVPTSDSDQATSHKAESTIS